MRGLCKGSMNITINLGRRKLQPQSNLFNSLFHKIRAVLYSSIEILRGQQKLIRKSSFKNCNKRPKQNSSDVTETERPPSSTERLIVSKIESNSPVKRTEKAQNQLESRQQKKMTSSIRRSVSCKSERYRRGNPVTEFDRFTSRVWNSQNWNAEKKKMAGGGWGEKKKITSGWGEVDVFSASRAICTATSASSSSLANIMDLSRMVNKLYSYNEKLHIGGVQKV